jgi:hypothetical protein
MGLRRCCCRSRGVQWFCGWGLLLLLLKRRQPRGLSHALLLLLLLAL